MLLYLIDLAGVSVFAVSGALAAARKRLDLLGIVVIATVTAIGGGTTRDLLLDRHPVFWIDDTLYLVVIAGAAVLTVVVGRWRTPHPRALEVADALGLGFFVIGGAGIALDLGLPTISVIVMGVVTGVAGGVIRDVLTNEIPLILAQGELYATAAIAGAAAYVALTSLGAPEPIPAFTGATVTIALRLAAIVWRLRLPVFTLRE
ncbi:MAG: trimeric intracellular cation channel family protein [Gemmatimonadota bacterium]|nr:trimeric intracellular cation channel family protein [Gemmatimonadota bacterium]